MSDRTIGILGLGIFGSSVLTALAKQDMNIIAIDDHAERINQFEPVLARGLWAILQMRNSSELQELIPVIRLWWQQGKIWSRVCCSYAL